jgi:hypothetical protein
MAQMHSQQVVAAQQSPAIVQAQQHAMNVAMHQQAAAAHAQQIDLANRDHEAQARAQHHGIKEQAEDLKHFAEKLERRAELDLSIASLYHSNSDRR